MMNDEKGNVKAPIIINIFLKQPRRGNTHEVQLTPHKRSAVWGLTMTKGTDCGNSEKEKRDEE